jgi:hypothetical protein
MNEYEISDAQDRYHGHPTLGPAVQTLTHLVDWTNANSDGWPYWRKPSRAAAQLMELITGDGTLAAQQDVDSRATVTAVRKALTPIKAFRTRQGADFTIVSP